MTRIVLLLAVLMSPISHAAAPALMKDGDYTVKVTHVAKHPNVPFPDAPIPDVEYKATDAGEEFRLVFSAKGSRVVILPRKISGTLTRADAEKRIYTLGKGLFAGGRLTVEKTKKGMVATFTEFGSGVMIIGSSRGSIVKAAK